MRLTIELVFELSVLLKFREVKVLPREAFLVCEVLVISFLLIWLKLQGQVGNLNFEELTIFTQFLQLLPFHFFALGIL